MRDISEIKADLKRAELNLKACLHEDGGLVSHAQWDVDRLELELFHAVKNDIPLDKLSQICEAERDGRCVIITEEIALAMSAGAGLIEEEHILDDCAYVYNYDYGLKAISYKNAAQILRELAKKVLKETEDER